MAVLALILILLLIGGVVFARTDYARDQLRERVNTLLREELGLEATFRDVEIQLFPPRGHVLGVEVQGSDGEPLLTVDRTTVGLSPAALFMGEVEITEISIEEPSLRLVIEDGQLQNLPEIRRPESNGDGEGHLADVGVLAATIVVEVRDAPGGPLRVELEDANFDLTADPSGDMGIRLLIAGGAIEQGDESHEIDLIQGRVMLREEQARLHHFRLRIGSLRALVPSATIGLSGSHDIDGAVELWAPLGLVASLPLPAPPLEGDLHVVVSRLQREEGRIEAEGNLEIAGLVIGPEQMGDGTMGPHSIGDVDAAFRYTPDQVAASELTINRLAERDGSLVIRDLTVDLSDDELPIAAEVELRGMRLGHILIDAGLYASRVQAWVDGTTTLAGNLRGLSLRCRPVNLTVRDFAVLTESIIKDDAQVLLAIPQATVRGTVVITEEEVRLRTMAVAFGQTSLSVSAELGFGMPRHWSLRAQAVDGRFNAEDVGPIAGLEICGSGRLQAHIHGSYGDPIVEGRVDLEEARLASVQLGHIIGPINYRGLLISLPGSEGTFGESRYRFEEGRVDFRRGGVAVDGVALLEQVHLQDAVEMLGIEMEAARPARGSVEGQARLSYRSGGNRWVVDVTGQVADAAYGEERLGDGEVDLTFDRGDIELRQLVLRDGTAEASASGRIGRLGSLDLDVRLPNYPIASIEMLPDALSGVQGRVRGAARIGGTTADIAATGWVEASPVTYNEARFGPSRIAFELVDDQVRAWGGLAGRSVRLDEVTLDMGRTWSLWVRGSVHQLRVASLLEPGQVPEGMSILLDGDVDGGIEFRQRPRFAGQATITSLGLRYQDIEVDSVDRIELSLERRRVNISTSSFAIRGAGLPRATSFTLGGWASAEAIGLDLQGTLDLGFIPSLIESVDTLTGSLSIDCQIGGALTEPMLMGRGTLRIDRLALAGVDQVAEDLTGTLRFSRNAVIFEELDARLMGGRARGSGRVTLSGLTIADYRLDLNVRDATLPVGPSSAAVANAAVWITNPRGDETTPLMGGRVELVRFLYEEPIRLLSTDIGQLSRRRVTSVRSYDPEGDVIRFDVQLVGGGNLRIDNNLARANIIIDDSARPLRIVGTNQGFSLLGTLVVERHGTVNFRNTHYEIERGILRFEDPFELNPTLDFVATATRRDWIITLQVSGTRHEPVITFRSDPPLAERDIASLLTFGFTAEEIERLGYDAMAAPILSEVISSGTGLDEEITRMLPMIDELRITTDYSARTGRAEPRVQVSRRVSSRIRLGASAGISETRDFEMNAEVELTEDLSIDAVYENDTDFGFGNIGGDLRWRIEF